MSENDDKYESLLTAVHFRILDLRRAIGRQDWNEVRQALDHLIDAYGFDPSEAPNQPALFDADPENPEDSHA